MGEWMGTPLGDRLMYLVSTELDSEHKLPCGDVYNKQIWYDGFFSHFSVQSFLMCPKLQSK